MNGPPFFICLFILLHLLCFLLLHKYIILLSNSASSLCLNSMVAWRLVGYTHNWLFLWLVVDLAVCPYLLVSKQ